MQVTFREFDPFDVWIWVQFPMVPSEMERQYLEEAFSSWFYLGKLGAFNAENLQIQDAGLEISYMSYDDDQAEGSMMALMHNMGEFEYEGVWARCWFDLGTSDALALDMLVNALRQLSKDFTTIEQLIIGGANETWPIPGSARSESFVDPKDNWN
jgi:Protein of unknown function (DUF3531)